MLIFSPLNMASMRFLQAALFRQVDQESECFVRDAILRIVEEHTNGFHCHTLPALGILEKAGAGSVPEFSGSELPDFSMPGA